VGRVEELVEAQRTEPLSDAERHENTMRHRLAVAKRNETARNHAMHWALGLLGRVIFPGRWDCRAGKHGTTVCEAIFEGRLRLQFTYSPDPSRASTRRMVYWHGPQAIGKQNWGGSDPAELGRVIERWQREDQERAERDATA
jgi:hypothetical protein